MICSYRGVKFFIDAMETHVEFAFMQNSVPFSWSEPKVEPIGRRATSYLLNSFVLGQDTADLLKVALDKNSPGLLLHPQFGVMTAHIVGYKLSQAAEKQGKIRFQIDVREAVEEASFGILNSVLDPVRYLETSLDEVRLLVAEALTPVLLAKDSTDRLHKITSKLSLLLVGDSGVIPAAVTITEALEDLARLPKRLGSEALRSSRSAKELAQAAGKALGTSSRPSQPSRLQRPAGAALEALVAIEALLLVCQDKELSEPVRKAMVEAFQDLLDPVRCVLPPVLYVAVKNGLAVLKGRRGKNQIPCPSRLPVLVAQHHLQRAITRKSRGFLVEEGELL